MNDQSSIKCPECGAEINVQNVLAHKIEQDLIKANNSKLAEERSKLEKIAEDLESQKKLLAKSVREEETRVNDLVEQQVKKQKVDLEQVLRAKLEGELSDQYKVLQDELARQSEKVKELNKAKADVARLNREKDQIADAVRAENEERLNKVLAEEKAKIKAGESDRFTMKIKELEKQLADQVKLTEQMKKKQEQGSMQLQGEVQELAIEEFLSTEYPSDDITEIKKGARGGDCLQVINTRTQTECGTIYYESKRTKDFQNSWIPKFKADIRESGADVGVIVTEAMPKDMDRMGLKNGVWICSFEEFKALSVVLRDALIRISNVKSAQVNRGDKMSRVYDYLTSNEFGYQIQAIVDGFQQMQKDLNKEKSAIQSAWKRREKQIELVLQSTAFLHGSITTIAGEEVKAVPALELPNYDK